MALAADRPPRAEATHFPGPEPCPRCGAPTRTFPADPYPQQVVDAEPAKGLVVGSLITTLERDDSMVVGAQHDGVKLVARVTQVWIPHQCLADQHRAAGQATRAGER